jgi:hypothetical protein
MCYKIAVIVPYLTPYQHGEMHCMPMAICMRLNYVWEALAVGGLTSPEVV